MRWSGLMEGKIERNYCRVLIVSVEALFPDHDVGRAGIVERDVDSDSDSDSSEEEEEEPVVRWLDSGEKWGEGEEHSSSELSCVVASSSDLTFGVRIPFNEPKLAELDFRGQVLEPTEVSVLAAAIQTLPSIKNLNLSGSRPTGASKTKSDMNDGRQNVRYEWRSIDSQMDGFAALCAVLGKLQKVDLSSCQLVRPILLLLLWRCIPFTDAGCGVTGLGQRQAAGRSFGGR